VKLFDKAKEVSSKVTESLTSFDSDEAIANTVIKAVAKQEKVNAILKEKGSNYRVADIELGMSVPPSVTFGVRRVNDVQNSDEIEQVTADVPQVKV
jgi:hypothetical protein